MRNTLALQDILEGKSSIDKFADEMHMEMKHVSDLATTKGQKRSVIRCTG